MREKGREEGRKEEIERGEKDWSGWEREEAMDGETRREIERERKRERERERERERRQKVIKGERSGEIECYCVMRVIRDCDIDKEREREM